MSKIKKLLAEDTVIVWGKIPVGEYRKFFEQVISKDFADNKDFQEWVFSQAGKTLKEAAEDHFNPPGHKNIEDLLSERRFNIVSEPDKAFIIAFDKAMNKLGYDCGNIIGSGVIWSPFMVIYGKTGTKSRPIIARIFIQEKEIQLRLFLNKIDVHRQYIETAPAHIKEPFIGPHNDCKSCKEKCGWKEYMIDGRLMRKCNPFWFFQPTLEKLSDYMGLLSEFYAKKPAK